MPRVPQDVYTQALICVLLGIAITGAVLIVAGLVMDLMGIP